MLSEKMQTALNEQINAEYFASYIYLSMSAYFQASNLNGFAHWMRAQSAEEMGHALKIFDYVNERGGRIVLTQVETPPSEWESPLAVFEAANAHERKVTGMINDLVNLAISEGDHATNAMLQWFVTEQVEEEASTGDIVHRLKMIGDLPSGLLMMDMQLGSRVDSE
ncbi:MAG: ferritin [SAR202 cluster bacterium]|jgi:ferritin|nr:ferritin [SAR202 cluster bacterium]|tara:strand:- start:62 stop:559 length:498 start_codon:yes stop_codon:yes gene_type:complete